VCLYDVDARKARQVKSGVMPFIEYGAEKIIKKVLKNGRLTVSEDIKDVSRAGAVIIAIGTPIDEHLNPKLKTFLGLIARLKKYLDPAQVVIVRSTVYPHTCGRISKMLGGPRGVKVAYCPERIAQGYAISELTKLPQIVSGVTPEAGDMAARLFAKVSPSVIRATVEEAELIKLFTNAWRYLQFAATNQFYMIARNYGVDYNKVRKAMREGYSRATNLPSAGFAAGPCLLKDTMQLAAFYGNNFLLGQTAMMINEGLPGFIAEGLKEKHDLSRARVGILGMSFKADIDDIRESLSYKLRKILRFYGATVYCSDEYVRDPGFIGMEELIRKSDIVIIGVPHSKYKGLELAAKKEIVDLWGIAGKGAA